MTPYAKEITVILIVKFFALFFVWWIGFSSSGNDTYSRSSIKNALLDKTKTASDISTFNFSPERKTK